MTQQTEGSEQMEQSLIDIAVESWRFSRLFGKVVSKLDAGESGRYANQLRYFQKKVEASLESSGLKLVNVEGQPYDPGMAASALNVGDFGPDDVLLVDQMVEPIIMGGACAEFCVNGLLAGNCRIVRSHNEHKEARRP